MNDGEIDEQDAGTAGSGSHSIAGYEYQIDVSVWLALDLVLASRLTNELVLEPATEEDIEADLDEYEPGRISSTASLDGYRLIVQAKMRSGDAWTVSGMQALLKHGEVRESAAKRLEDPHARYLLITNAGLNGGTRALRVRRAGNWPKAADIPAMIKSALPSGSPGRVAIIGNQDEERLETDIKRLLIESFRIPNSLVDECRKALREEARMRIVGVGAGRWTRPQLEQIIRRYDGYIASSPELEQYVHPTNWLELCTKMGDRHAALIVGQSGTGKTMATRKLYEELRELVPGLTRVAITLGPQQLRDDKTDPPVLYDIEDPWGRYDFDPTSRPWNDQLAQFFGQARHDRMIVATSRLDVAQSSGALDTVKPWQIALEAEHYAGPQRHRLYQTRIDALPRKLQILARQSESSVLAELATPLEIQKFFDALPTLDDGARRNPAALVAEAIRSAHENSIERTVVDQVEGRSDVRAAAVIWGLLKANDKLSLRLLRQIEEGIAEKGSQFERGVSPLVTFFVAARNLRQVDSTVTYYHPRVEAGIEKALLRDSLVVRRTLHHLIDILVSFEDHSKAWGVSASARLLLAITRTPDLKPDPSASAQSLIDTWIAAELTKGGKEFEENLNLAAAAGSKVSNVAEVARFLNHRPDKSFGGLHLWGPLKHDEAWYERMRRDHNVKALVETFIRNILPNTRDDFRANFVGEVERLAPGLTPAFLAAAAEAVHYGFTHTCGVIAQGALNDISGFEKIIDAAVNVLTPSEDGLQRAAETHLSIVNIEHSDDYAEHLSENDDGYTASEFLSAYVDRVRKMGVWQKIADHRHRDWLLRYWFRALINDNTPQIYEVAGAFAAGCGTKDKGDLWHVVAKTWDCSFERVLIDRLIEGHQDPAIRVAALTCVIQRMPDQIGTISRTLLDQDDHSRLVELAIELGELRHWRSRLEDLEVSEAAERAAMALPTAFRELCEAAYSLEIKTVPILSDATRQYLIKVSTNSEAVRLFRLSLDSYMPILLSEDIRWLLANTEEVGNAVKAIEAAIRHEMTDEINVGLSHKFAHVVALSLRAVATPLTPPLPENILALARAKGSPIRQELVKMLDAKPHADHLQTLLHLSKDEWSLRSSYYGEQDDYPIAQAAISAIAKLGSIDNRVADELYRVAIDTSDPDLRYEIFALLAHEADPSFQTHLFELAVNPGRQVVRKAAADALLYNCEHIIPEILAQITPQLLATRIESVASRLLLLLSHKGKTEDIIKSAQELASKDKRRVLLLLAVWVLSERDLSTANRIANMLPTNHAGVRWALVGAKGKLDDTALDDLGDPLSVDQVLLFMRPNTKKR